MPLDSCDAVAVAVAAALDADARLDWIDADAIYHKLIRDKFSSQDMNLPLARDEKPEDAAEAKEDTAELTTAVLTIFDETADEAISVVAEDSADVAVAVTAPVVSVAVVPPVTVPVAVLSD